MHFLLENELIPVTQSGIINAFSGGQDSSFLLVCLFHKIKQREVVIIHSYQNHLNQTMNIYAETQNWKLLRNCSVSFLSSLFCSRKRTEVAFSDFRSDILIRQLTFFKYFYILTSHSQSDVLESLFVDFLHKTILAANSCKKEQLKYNKILYDWPSIESNFIQKPNSGLIKKSQKWPITIKKNRNQKSSFLLRPLFLCSRDIIKHFLMEEKIPKQNDYTNFNRTYLHNYCRHELIPLLKLKLGRDFSRNFFFGFSKSERTAANVNLFLNQKYRKTERFICLEITEPLKKRQILNILTRLNPFFLFDTEKYLLEDLKLKKYLVIQIIKYPQILITRNFLIIRFR